MSPLVGRDPFHGNHEDFTGSLHEPSFTCKEPIRSIGTLLPPQSHNSIRLLALTAALMPEISTATNCNSGTPEVLKTGNAIISSLKTKSTPHKKRKVLHHYHNHHPQVKGDCTNSTFANINFKTSNNPEAFLPVAPTSSNLPPTASPYSGISNPATKTPPHLLNPHYNIIQTTNTVSSDEVHTSEDNANIKPSSKSLVNPRDRKTTTSFTYALVKQMVPCFLTEDDRVGKRRSLPVGFAGLACRFCHDTCSTGRFFPSNIKTMSDTSKSLNIFYNHMLKCHLCPPQVATELKNLRFYHDLERGSLMHGSQRAFFSRIWSRLHTSDQDNNKNNMNKISLCGPLQIPPSHLKSQHSVLVHKNLHLLTSDTLAISQNSLLKNTIFPPANQIKIVHHSNMYDSYNQKTSDADPQLRYKKQKIT